MNAPDGDICSSPIARCDDLQPEIRTSSVADILPKKGGRSKWVDAPEIALWSTAKRQSWAAIERNPNAFYYRHVAPGAKKRTGAWNVEEKRLFMEAIKVHPPSQGKWGLFAQHIPGRVGYQCRNFYHHLLKSGQLRALPGELERIRRPRHRPAPIPADDEEPEIRIESDQDDDNDEGTDDDDEAQKADDIELESIVFFSSKIDAGEPESQEEEDNGDPVPRKWSPRMRQPWTSTGSRFVRFPPAQKPPRFEYQVARLMRLNIDSPANLIMLSLPSGAANAEYLAAMRAHLEKDAQEQKNELLRKYFSIISADEAEKAAAEEAFVQFVIETIH
jgi:hypothetical protein